MCRGRAQTAVCDLLQTMVCISVYAGFGAKLWSGILADRDLLQIFSFILFKSRFEVVVLRGVRDGSEGLSLSPCRDF